MDRVCELQTNNVNYPRSPKLHQKAVLQIGEIFTIPSVGSLRNLQSSMNIEQRLRFNVGGLYFEILQKKLDRYPDTLLGGERKNYFFDEVKNEYFFDRDPVTFKYILDFYRTGKFHISTPDCMESIQDELAFFGIPEAFVSECCCEHISFEKDVVEEETIVQINIAHVYNGREKLHEFLTNFQSSMASAVFSYFFVLVVIINIGLIVAETLECEIGIKCGKYYQKFFFCVDSFCVAVFTFEFFARLYSCPHRNEFLKDVSNLVDLMGILPYYFGIIEKLAETNSDVLQSLITTLRICRIFRVIKLARHSEQFQTLLHSIAQAAGELGGILFSFLALMIMFSTIIFSAENGGMDNQDGFTSIPAAFWYTLVTMTTLGYGDIVPYTFIGKIIGTMCALAGVVLLALPVPIIEEKLNANSKKLNRKKDQKAYEGLKITKRLAASLASIRHFPKRKAGLTSQLSQSSNVELSCNENMRQDCSRDSIEKISGDYLSSSSDETIKAAFLSSDATIEGTAIEMEPIVVHRYNPEKMYRNPRPTLRKQQSIDSGRVGNGVESRDERQSCNTSDNEVDNANSFTDANKGNADVNKTSADDVCCEKNGLDLQTADQESNSRLSV